MTARALRTSRGFSLIELLVASAIILVVAAIATPSIVRSIRAYRVGSVGIEVSNILQRTRYEAIRRNIRTTCRGQVTGGQWQVWIDYNNDQRVDANEPFILVPADMAFLGADQVPDVGSMGYPATRQIVGAISFDARGTVDFGPAAPAVMLAFVGVPTDPSAGYRAIAVTPAGKTRMWRAAAKDQAWH